jgi:phage/plasmid-like protein (TIGR03299 family)
LAHEVESMMSVRTVPWHGISTVLPAYPKSREELLEAAGMEWTVGTFPVAVQLPDGTSVIAPDKQGVVRLTDNKFMSIMGSGYVPIQPYELVDFALALLNVEGFTPGEDGNPPILMETAMSLSEGRVNVLTCKVPQQILVGGIDPVDLFLVFCNSHDGSLRMGVHATPIRVVCMNTLNASFKTAVQSWGTKHTQGATNAISEARRTLNLTWAYADTFQKEMDALLTQDFTKRQFEQMVSKLFPKAANDRAPFSREQYSLIGLLESSPTIDDGFRYTKYGAFNAVTEFMDWNTRFNEGGPPIEEKRTQHCLFGRAKQNADKTFQYLSGCAK